MILHHFTARQFLPEIAAEGLRLGDVPTSRATGFNAVWLTTSADPKGHGLAQMDGRLDKMQIRLTVDLPDGAPGLHHWSTWAEANGVSRKWRRILNTAAGGGASTWWFYLAAIPADMLTAHDAATGVPVTGWPDLQRARYDPVRAGAEQAARTAHLPYSIERPSR